MKLNVFYALIVSLALSSCCNEDPVETARYELKDQELVMIPYQQGESIPFKHSNGLEFNFYVAESKVEWMEYHEFCEWFCCPSYYFSYQTKTAQLESEYPRLSIRLSVGGTQYGDYSPMQLAVNLNYSHLAAIQYDSTYQFVADTIYRAIIHESILVNNAVFEDVIEKYFDYYGSVPDSTILMPKSILYNKQVGLIQIKMTNDESYTINN